MKTAAEVMTAIPPSRIALLCLAHSDEKSESEDGIPEANRAAFWEDVNYNVAFAAKWFEEVCRFHGSSDGTYENIPDARKLKAMHRASSQDALHELKCAYELELRRIDNREREASDAREAREHEARQRQHDANAGARREARKRDAADFG